MFLSSVHHIISSDKVFGLFAATSFPWMYLSLFFIVAFLIKLFGLGEKGLLVNDGCVFGIVE